MQRTERHCTPPPPRAEYMLDGARVSMPALPVPVIECDDAAGLAFRARADEKRDAAVLNEMLALLADRPTRPARKAVRS